MSAERPSPRHTPDLHTPAPSTLEPIVTDDRVPPRLGAARALVLFLTAMIAFWLVGYLPWILGGMQLPISSAWPGFGADPPRVALPWGEYQVWSLITGAIIGGIAAAVTSRLPWLDHPQDRRATRLVAALGGAVGAVVAVSHNAIVLSEHLSDRAEAQFLTYALFATYAVGVGVGVMAGVGILSDRPWVRGLAVAVLATFLLPWLSEIIARLTTDGTSLLFRLPVWFAGAVLSTGLAYFGFRPGSRLIGWALAVGIFWVAPAIAAAVGTLAPYARSGSISSSAGMRDLLDTGWQTFRSALSPANREWQPVALAVVLGILLAVAIRRQPTVPDPNRDQLPR